MRVDKSKKWAAWLNKKENSEDLLLAFLLLVTFAVTSIITNIWISFGNRPAYTMTLYEQWSFIPLTVVVYILLIAIFFFEIRLTKRNLLRKLINTR